jgi:hypothetical protein
MFPDTDFSRQNKWGLHVHTFLLLSMYNSPFNVLLPSTEFYRLYSYITVMRNKTTAQSCQYYSLTLDTIPKYFLPIPIITTYVHKINIFFPTVYQYLNQTLRKTFTRLNFVHIPCLPGPSSMISPAYPP